MVDKERVYAFWNQQSCGEVYTRGAEASERDAGAERTRYALEPYIAPFARFSEGFGKDVLEIGVGMGLDHLQWARRRPARLCGIDLTPRAIEHTQRLLREVGFVSELRVADAEQLPFDDNAFDIVYSYGVLHHTPDTPRAIDEVWRVLKPGGCARIMIYHRRSIVGLLLWLRYALLRGQPHLDLNSIYAQYLESPGTKAYSVADARALFRRFAKTDIQVQMSFGDLLLGEVGQRHHGFFLSVAKRLWPRALLRRLPGDVGLAMLIEAHK